ncbi:MAG: glycosyltransferase [Nitrospiraceae bacterium]|nr:glycosyltransferase [Nitrospiraceae bacterium]
MSSSMRIDSPLITVVVPAYNRATTITDSVRSVQAQTYANWELIVVDDGSSDSTPQVVAKLAKEDPRIRLIQQPRNGGAQAARNAGIRAATGTWVAFLDSDDQYLPDSLERRMNLAKKERVRVVHSECYVLGPDGVKKVYRVPPIRGNAYSTLLSHEGPVYPGILVAKDALQRIDLLDEHIAAFQEWDTSIRLAKYYQFAFETTPTFIYDCRHADTMSKDLLRGGRGYEQVFRKHFFAILSKVGPRGLVYHYRVAARWYEGGKDQQAAKRCALLSRLWSLCDVRSLPGRAFKRLRRAL